MSARASSGVGGDSAADRSPKGGRGRDAADAKPPKNHRKNSGKKHTMPLTIKSAAAHMAVALLFLLSLLLAAAAQPPTTASATSQAQGNADVTSLAASVDGGAATVIAVGTAPSGEQRVVVDCRLAANRASEQLIKFCEGIPAVGGGGGNAPDAEAKAWRDAPACTAVAARGGKVVVLDSAGRAWGREPDEPSGRPCAFRDDAGGARNSGGGGGGQQPPGGGREEDANKEWEQAPDCRGDPASSDSGFFSRDYSGRAWGWQNGESCAWRSVRPVGGVGGGGGGGR